MQRFIRRRLIVGFRAKDGRILEIAEFVHNSRAAMVKVYRVE